MDAPSRRDMKIATLGMAAALLLSATLCNAQARFDGTAVVRIGDTQHSIPIVCDDADRPETGFSTEPTRVTRAATGRSSSINLRLRRWQDTDELIVTLDRYVAWMPIPQSVNGVLSVELDMSPISITRNNFPVMLSYDMWSTGDRPLGLEAVTFEADCSQRLAEVPVTRRITD